VRALQFHHVDVFTERPFEGNALAVYLDADDVPADLMQHIAREMNLSETTFVQRSEDPACAFRVRIFTPGQELPFAGHPTVGTAFVLHRLRLIDQTDFSFLMKVGRVPVRREGNMFWIAPPLAQPQTLHQLPKLAAALHVPPSSCGAAYVITNGVRFLCAVLATQNDVDLAQPDRALLANVGADLADIDILVFSYESGRAYSRMFPSPFSGIGEDPATGSSVAPLCLSLKLCGRLERDASTLTVEQGTKMGRQSFLHARFQQDDDALRDIWVGGTAVHVFESVIHIEDRS